jgi:hypothetical protein
MVFILVHCTCLAAFTKLTVELLFAIFPKLKHTGIMFPLTSKRYMRIINPRYILIVIIISKYISI